MNFDDIKNRIKAFVKEELFPLEPWILNCSWDEKLPKLNELRKKVKDGGLWLPQVPKDYGGFRAKQYPAWGNQRNFRCQSLRTLLF